MNDTAPDMWSDGLAEWFAVHGRHRLPWRLTTDPWAVLVSEVMLQQTSVARVLPHWERFVGRWPDPAACAAAGLDDVLRQWQGLGYPRRARSLWLTAARVTAGGWPNDEAGLRTLPGVGTYTARALLAFSDVGGEAPATLPPRDVNIARVAARAALGREPHQVPARALDAVLCDGRDHSLPLREYAYALFDVGAAHCRPAPRCAGCALTAACAFRRGDVTPERPRRQPRYPGSLRQLRGAILAAALHDPSAGPATLRESVAAVPGATPARFDEALAGLVADGLLGSLSGESAPRR